MSKAGASLDLLDVMRIREDFPVLGREVNGRPLAYLDSAATSRNPRQVVELLSELYPHADARAVRSAVTRGGSLNGC